MEHTTVPQMCSNCNLLPLIGRPGPMTFTKRFIACSVCTVDLAFMLNVMQCKEILYIICKIAIIVNQNIIEDVRRIKMKTKIRSPSLCKDCLDYSWHVVIMSRSSSARSWVCSFRFSLCSFHEFFFHNKIIKYYITSNRRVFSNHTIASLFKERFSSY